MASRFGEPEHGEVDRVGDEVARVGLVFETGTYGMGFWSGYGAGGVVYGPGGLTAIREPVPNGDYYIGFYACDPEGYYIFQYETITINR